jgi:deoxyribose-phosphate aldolase
MPAPEGRRFTRGEVAARIDLAMLAAGIDRKVIRAGCREARELEVAAVCVAPAWVEEAAERLAGGSVRVCAVVGFPLGATTLLTKVFEALECVKHGAAELDVVLHVGAARSGDFRAVREEARELVERTPEASHKLIVEMALLDEETLRRTVVAAAAAGPAFLKTGTGTAGPGVTPEDVARLRRLTPEGIRLKAAGGIRSASQAEALLRAGADRLGTSAAREVIEGFPT